VRKLFLILSIMSLFVCCEMTTPGKYTPDTPGEADTVAITNHLFIPGDEGVVSFRTNDLQYYSLRGCTLGCLLEGEESGFSSREVSLSKSAGNASAGYGLICCCRNDPVYGVTFLVVLINTEKEYVVAEIGADFFEEIVPWQESGLLVGGYNQRNMVRVEYNSDTRDYLLRFNGGLETVFRDDEEPLHTSGQQGYMVVISPLDDFPAIPVEVQFKEQSNNKMGM